MVLLYLAVHPQISHVGQIVVVIFLRLYLFNLLPAQKEPFRISETLLLYNYFIIFKSFTCFSCPEYL